MSRLFPLLICFLSITPLFSQEKRGIQHFGVEEGLSQSSTFDIVQDDQGFIWIATADGLNRFDGYNFKVFKSDPQDSFALHQSGIRNLFYSKNSMWIATGGTMELYRMDLFTQKIEKIFSFNKSAGWGFLPFKEEADTIWIMTTDNGVIKVNTKTRKIIEQFPGGRNSYPSKNQVVFDSTSSTLWYIGLPANHICSFSLITKTYTDRKIRGTNNNDTIIASTLYYCADHKIRIGIQNGIITYDPGLNDFQSTMISSEPITSASDRILTLLETENGSMWCGSNQGITYLFDENKKTFTRKNESTSSVGGFRYRVIRFMLDKTKNLWIGTDPNGLYKIDTKAKPFNHTYSDPKNSIGLKSNFIKCFIQVKDEIYIATYDKGINVYNRKDGSFRFINGFNNSTGNFPIIFAMAADSSGEIYVCTDEGLGIIEKGNSFLTKPTVFPKNEQLGKYSNTICILPDQSVIVGTITGLYQLKKNKDSFQYIPFNLNEFIESLLVDNAGNLWVGTLKGLYFSEKTSTEFFQNFKLVITGIGRVKCIYQYSNGTIWVGSVEGLYKINSTKRTLERTYSEKDGLPNTFIYGIVEDESGNLWLSTNRGLSKFNPTMGTFRNYSVSDGLQSNEFNTGAYLHSSTGELYFGGINGFNHFLPDNIQNNPFVPSCVITSLKIFDQPYVTDSSIECKKHITLDYTRNNILLEYVALEFSDPTKNSFKYRLVGLDSNWVNVGKERFARFVNLSPGEYIFQVKAANNDGIWNNVPREIRITITPPFWKTLPFIFSISILSLALLLLIIRTYLRFQLRIRTRELELKQSVRMNAIIETEEKERKRIAGELHDGLGQLLSTARLNMAGFEDSTENKDNILLKNSLHLIDEACAEVRTISHNMMPGALIRLGLMAAVNELVNKINDTEKLKIEYDTNLEERFSETIEIAIYRIVQEALSNMIKHADAKTINVSIKKAESELEITITDDGKSFDVSEIQNSEGLGWHNIYSRVELLNGHISVQSEMRTGTSIFITIPIK